MGDEVVLGEDIPLGNPLELTFTEHGQRFITLDRLLCRVEGHKPQAEIHKAFYPPMLLFYHIIRILAVSEQAGLGERSLVLEGLDSQGYAPFLSMVMTRGVRAWEAWST